MTFDAILPAGGRAMRMGGVSKPLLRVAGISLLERALLAAGAARNIVVVGPAELPALAGAHRACEDPPFGGPAAAVAAGLDLLQRLGDPAPWLLVLATDQPAAELLVPPLLAAAEPASGPVAIQALIGTDAGGRRQLLTALYATGPLSAAVRRLRKRKTGLSGAAFGELVSGLVVQEVALPDAAAGDIDTWADATRWGATR